MAASAVALPFSQGLGLETGGLQADVLAAMGRMVPLRGCFCREVFQVLAARPWHENGAWKVRPALPKQETGASLAPSSFHSIALALAALTLPRKAHYSCSPSPGLAQSRLSKKAHCCYRHAMLAALCLHVVTRAPRASH
jgi:hypothetical protein